MIFGMPLGFWVSMTVYVAVIGGFLWWVRKEHREALSRDEKVTIRVHVDDNGFLRAEVAKDGQGLS